MNSKPFAAALVAMALSLGANELDNPVADVGVSSRDLLIVRGALNPQASVSVAGELTLTNATHDIALPLRHRDVLGFSKGGYLIGTYGMETRLRRFIAVFRSLPAVPMQEVPGVGDEMVHVRDVEYEGRRYFYVVNTDFRARTFSLPWAGTSCDLVTGERFKDRLELTLEPYDLRSFKMEK